MPLAAVASKERIKNKWNLTLQFTSSLTTSSISQYKVYKIRIPSRCAILYSPIYQNMNMNIYVRAINIASSAHLVNEFDLFISVLSRLYDYRIILHEIIVVVITCSVQRWERVIGSCGHIDTTHDVRSTYIRCSFNKQENEIAYVQTSFLTQHGWSIGPHMQCCRPKRQPFKYTTQNQTKYLFSLLSCAWKRLPTQPDPILVLSPRTPHVTDRILMQKKRNVLCVFVWIMDGSLLLTFGRLFFNRRAESSAVPYGQYVRLIFHQTIRMVSLETDSRPLLMSTFASVRVNVRISILILAHCSNKPRMNILCSCAGIHNDKKSVPREPYACTWKCV